MGVHLYQVVIGIGEVISELLGGRCFHCPVFNAHMGGISVSELEGGKLCGQVLTVVNGELGKSQPFRPMVLFFGTEEAQVLLDFPVHDFCVTICVRVVCSGELGRNSKSLAEVHHDLQSKLWSAI